MIFQLPMPPSVNALFATDFKTKRRFISKAYTEWKGKAGEELRRQYAAFGSPGVHKPVAVSIRLGLNYHSDIANREKAITDLLVDVLDMPDDRYVDCIVIERDQSIKGAIVTVEGSYTGRSECDGPRQIGEIIPGGLRQIQAAMRGAA